MKDYQLFLKCDFIVVGEKVGMEEWQCGSKESAAKTEVSENTNGFYGSASFAMLLNFSISNLYNISKIRVISRLKFLKYIFLR